MKTKKIFTIIFLILVSVTTFFGCAKVEFIRAIDSLETIIDKLAISLDESKINKAGEDLAVVMGKIDGDMIHFRNKVNDWKIIEFAEYPELYEAVRDGIKVEVTKPRKNEISIAIEFANWQMFGLFYGYAVAEDFEYTAFLQDRGPFIANILSSDYEDNDYGLFLIKYAILKNSGIEEDLQNFEFDGTNYYEKYRSMFMNRYGMEEVEVSQIFAFPDDRLQSNADDNEVQGDLTLLRWDLSNKTDDFEMTIYKITANTTSWYVLALALSAVSVIIITIVINKKSKGQIIQIIEKKDLDK